VFRVHLIAARCIKNNNFRVGELEAETMHRSTLLDEAHHKIGELERR